MYSFRSVITETDVCVERNGSPSLMRRGRCVRSIVSVLSIGLVLTFSFRAISEAATRQDLKNEINALLANVNRDVSQDIEVINAISAAIAAPLSITMGTVEADKGKGVHVPVYFKSGTDAVSAMQFDVTVSTGLTVTGAVAGQAALAASKSVQVGQVSGGFRVLVFGINNNAIDSGQLVVLTVGSLPTTISGKKSISMANISASSPLGQSVTLTSKNGSLTVK